MRRTRIDFYHLFDEDELFLAPVILIVKKFRLAIGVATVQRQTLGLATVNRLSVGMATINQRAIGLSTRQRIDIGISTVTRTKTQG